MWGWYQLRFGAPHEHMPESMIASADRSRHSDTSACTKHLEFISTLSISTTVINSKLICQYSRSPEPLLLDPPLLREVMLPPISSSLSPDTEWLLSWSSSEVGDRGT